MWDRKELKARGKAAFKANYWPSVVAALVLGIATATGTSSTASSVRSSTNSAEVQEKLSGMDQGALITILFIILGAVAVILLLSILANAFIFNPLRLGGQRFFLVNAEQPAALGELGYAFKNNYLNIVKVLFVRGIYLALWSMLFVIPGIVKSYSYRLVPYIMAEDPTMGANEAITLSRQLMQGNKMQAFILDLSFLGWHILGAITFGLVGVFYTSPYVAATDAELYRTLRHNV